MKIDEDFVKGVGYYIGDGRMTAPRSLSTVNQDTKIIRFFIKWLKKYFKIKNENIIIKIMTNKSDYDELKLKKYFSKKLRINRKYIRSVSLKPNAKSHHNILIEASTHSVSAKRNFDQSIPIVKSRSLKNKKLAEAYLKGIMAAEGSPKYHIKSGSKSVHLKMKNEEEIKYLGELLNNVLRIDSSILRVKNEEGMWLITISGIKELKRLYDFNVFELTNNKKTKLENMIKSYKREQVKKGTVDIFYIKNLIYFNKKYKKCMTAPELSKLIKRHKSRTINVLRQLERKKLVKSRRRTTTGRPFEFWINKNSLKSINLSIN
jgi:hypothetical protein